MNNQFNQYNPTQPIQPQGGFQTPFYSPPQPVGMVYPINSSQELNTIPYSMGTTYFLCAPENKIIVRTFTNGNLDLKEFSLAMPQNEKSTPTGAMEEIIKRIERLEKLSTQDKKGGQSEWQL
jgi:hypothetical protein